MSVKHKDRSNVVIWSMSAGGACVQGEKLLMLDGINVGFHMLGNLLVLLASRLCEMILDEALGYQDCTVWLDYDAFTYRLMLYRVVFFLVNYGNIHRNVICLSFCLKLLGVSV